ncbi:hypothetical protein BJY04DRAFT_7853 [Aspergillus karnatakaensis]|uniref:uncharacterized protein n=1 Tax=Aspergillus karnatakaensis TaxID=1810916 RepID=UPI003CCDF52D
MASWPITAVWLQVFSPGGICLCGPVLTPACWGKSRGERDMGVSIASASQISHFRTIVDALGNTAEAFAADEALERLWNLFRMTSGPNCHLGVGLF